MYQHPLDKGVVDVPMYVLHELGGTCILLDPLGLPYQKGNDKGYFYSLGGEPGGLLHKG